MVEGEPAAQTNPCRVDPLSTAPCSEPEPEPEPEPELEPAAAAAGDACWDPAARIPAISRSAHEASHPTSEKLPPTEGDAVSASARRRLRATRAPQLDGQRRDALAAWQARHRRMMASAGERPRRKTGCGGARRRPVRGTLWSVLQLPPKLALAGLDV